MKVTLLIFVLFLILSVLGTIGMYLITDKEKTIAIGYLIYSLMITLAISFLFALKELRLYCLKFFEC